MKSIKYLGLVVIAVLVWSFTIKNTNTEKKLVWHTDMKKAVEVAQKEDKPVFMFFTGSDWCGWCIRLQKEVFKTAEFEAWAKKNVVLVELDFPRKTAQEESIKTQNAQLQQMFGIQGYPTVWLVKAGKKEGKINFEQLGSTGYVAGGPKVWLDGANQILAKYTPNKKTNKLRKVKS